MRGDPTTLTNYTYFFAKSVKFFVKIAINVCEEECMDAHFHLKQGIPLYGKDTILSGA